MLKVCKKKAIKTEILVFIGMFVAAIIILAFSKFSIFTYLWGAKKLPQGADLADYEGEYVSYTVKYPLIGYMEEYLSNKPEKATGSSYAVYDTASDGFICVAVSYDQNDKIKSLMNEVYKDLEDGTIDEMREGIEVKGTVVRMTNKEKNYYEQAIEQVAGSNSIEAMNQNYCIHDNEIKNIDTTFMWLMTGISLLIIVIAILLGVLRVKRAGKKEVKKFLKKHPDVTADMLEQDFAVSKALKPGLWIGEKFIFIYIAGMYIVPYQELARVYHNGRASRTETRIRFVLTDRNEIEYLMTEENVQEALNLIAVQMPNVLVG